MILFDWACWLCWLYTGYWRIWVWVRIICNYAYCCLRNCDDKYSVRNMRNRNTPDSRDRLSQHCQPRSPHSDGWGYLHTYGYGVLPIEKHGNRAMTSTAATAKPTMTGATGCVGCSLRCAVISTPGPNTAHEPFIVQGRLNPGTHGQYR